MRSQLAESITVFNEALKSPDLARYVDINTDVGRALIDQVLNQQAMFIAWFFMVLFVLLSGLFTPVESMPPWAQKITLFNPVVYLVNGFRWSFYGVSDVKVGLSVGMTAGFMCLCLAVIHWMFRTGYKLKN